MNTDPCDRTDALLQEYGTLEYILLGDLRDLLEEPPDEVTCRWLMAVLDALLDTLPRQFNLKQQGGYLRDVLDDFPHWDGEVQRLEEEHTTLFGQLKELRCRIGEQAVYEDIAGQVREGLREWLRLLSAFHRHEKRLVQTAANLMVGVGD